MYPFLSIKSQNTPFFLLQTFFKAKKMPFESKLDFLSCTDYYFYQNTKRFKNELIVSFEGKYIVNEIFTYFWVFDQWDTLNNYSIRNGCMYAEDMERPETWEEFSEVEKVSIGKKRKLYRSGSVCG